MATLAEQATQVRGNWELCRIHKLEYPQLDYDWLDRTYNDGGKTFSIEGLLYVGRVKRVVVRNGSKFATRTVPFIASKMAK